MRKTEHHTIEGNRKTKNSIKRLFFCLLAIFLQIAFFLSISALDSRLVDRVFFD